MLVLTRKLGQQILIDGRIKVAVVDIRRGRVRLGITCPNDVCIMRSELVAQDGAALHPLVGKSAPLCAADHLQMPRDDMETGCSGKPR